jgi:hypothetical protein
MKQSISRDFVATWPAVLAEMKDFVALTRLATGGDYREMSVRVVISKKVSAERLDSSLSSPFGQFRTMLEALPRCRVEFAAADCPAHSVDVEIQR